MLRRGSRSGEGRTEEGVVQRKGSHRGGGRTREGGGAVAERKGHWEVAFYGSGRLIEREAQLSPPTLLRAITPIPAAVIVRGRPCRNTDHHELQPQSGGCDRQTRKFVL